MKTQVYEVASKEYIKDLEEFKKDLKNKKAIKPKMLYIPLRDNIIEGDRIIYDDLASWCVIVLLWDPENKRGGLLHIATPIGVQDLQYTIDRMKEMGSKKIISVLAGGMGRSEISMSVKNWRKITKILRKNAPVVQSFKHGGLKDFGVDVIALWTKTGKVKFAGNRYMKTSEKHRRKDESKIGEFIIE